jgi:hypothetical protein
MNSNEYVKLTQLFSEKNYESRWFVAEVNYYAAAGRVLDLLKNHLKLGYGIDKDSILRELGNLLKTFVELCVCTMSHNDFISHEWSKSKEMVPAGVSGCANGILNMIRATSNDRRIHFLANACSHLGFSFIDVAQSSVDNLKDQYPDMDLEII